MIEAIQPTTPAEPHSALGVINCKLQERKKAPNPSPITRK
jgi:hypothetical protein